MTSNALVFIPKGTQTARENLTAFVEMCRTRLTMFGEDLPFEQNIWDVTGWISTKGVDHATRIRFSNLATSSNWKSSLVTPMTEPFLSFAKSYLRYRYAHVRSHYSSSELIALRAIEAALIDLTGGAHPSDINPAVLGHAAQKVKARLAPNTAYSVGTELQYINKVASEFKLLIVPSSWRNSIPPPGGLLNRVGEEHDRRRIEKFPSPAAFYALGHVFREGKTADDILVSSVCALLCSAPSRISEIVMLPSVCEVYDADKRTGAKAYGMSFRPAKGGPPMVKYIATAMHDIAREALQRLRDLSAPALELVRWYEKNPDNMFLPPELEHLRGKKDLTMLELVSIVFIDDGNTHHFCSRGHQWTNDEKIPTFRKAKGLVKVHADFADVEAAILKKLPKKFPFLYEDQNLKYSDALMVVRMREIDQNRVTYRCMFQSVKTSDIYSRIATSKKLNIFIKHGLKEDDGNDIELSTHKFRHYLNTLAQLNNMDQLDIARWSGRQHVSQNAAYDHVSDQEATQKFRLAVMGKAAAVGPIAHLHKVVLVARDQFARLRIPTAHTTDYGYCVHDFSMLPCQQHQDCINCDEHACIKGQSVRKDANIRATRDETELLLASAKEASDDNVYGADRWVLHQQLTLDRLNSLCSILDDQNVPDGAVIRLDDSPTQSQIERATMRRGIATNYLLPAANDLPEGTA